jgi:hypothetical protein
VIAFSSPISDCDVQLIEPVIGILAVDLGVHMDMIGYHTPVTSVSVVAHPAIEVRHVGEQEWFGIAVYCGDVAPHHSVRQIVMIALCERIHHPVALALGLPINQLHI